VNRLEWGDEAIVDFRLLSFAAGRPGPRARILVNGKVYDLDGALKVVGGSAGAETDFDCSSVLGVLDT